MDFLPDAPTIEIVLGFIGIYAVSLPVVGLALAWIWR